MRYDSVATILNILSTVHFQYQERELIGELNEFFDFDHNIFLLESTSYHHRYICMSSNNGGSDDQCVPQTVLLLNDESRTDIGRELKSITSKNTFLIAVVETPIDSRFLSKIQSIRELKTNMKIGVFFVHAITTPLIIENMFRWSWRVKILNIFSAFYLNQKNGTPSDPLLNVFKYDPFRTFKMINVTGSTSIANVFPDKKPNFQRYPLRFSVIIEINNFLHDELFWETVAKKFNATISGTLIHMSGRRNAIDYILPYEAVLHDGNFTMYPHKLAHFVMMVPHAQPETGYVAILKNLTSESLFGYTFIVILGICGILAASRYLHKSKIPLLESVADVLNLLMNDNATIRYQHLRLADIWIIVPLTFVGFVIVNGLLSIFISHASVELHQNQIRTFDDLYHSSVPLLMEEDTLNYFTEILENLSPHDG